MAEFEERIRQQFTEPADEITPDDAEIDLETRIAMYKDQAAVKMVLDDANQADNFLNINNWPAGWTDADTILQSPTTTSAFSSQNSQANVPKYTLSNHLSAIVPKILQSVFYEDPPFLLRPRPAVGQDIVRAKTAIASYQLDDMKFEEEAEALLEQQALFGTCIAKWGWTEYKENYLTYKRKSGKKKITESTGRSIEVDTPDSDDFEEVLVDHLISRPWIKFCDIRTVLVDPGCRRGDIRKAKWVIWRDYPTFEDLDKLRDVEGYTIPAEDLLKQIFMRDITSPGMDNISMTIPEGMRGYIQHALPRNYKTSADPLQNGLEILERWDKDKIIVILRYKAHSILIRNEENPYKKIPFYSANWRNVPDNFYGQGLGLLVGSEQLVEQSITNLSLDLLAYGLQPTAVRTKGFNVPTQQTRWKQGGIIDVDSDDVRKGFGFLTMPPVPSEAWQFINQAKSDAAASSGSNEIVGQGNSQAGAHSTGMRSGTGAAAVVAANASRLDGPSGRFVRQIFAPWLYQMDELNNRYLPTEVLREVLGNEIGKDPTTNKPFDVDHMDFRKAQIDFEVLAGAKLGAKKEMAQFLPIMLQTFNNPTFTQSLADSGQKWDALAIFKTFCDAAGWKFSQNFVVPMTPQEKQMHAQNTPAALQQQKLQAASQSQLQQFQQEQTLEDQKALGRAGAEVLRQTTQHALDSEEINGEPGNVGFGSENTL